MHPWMTKLWTRKTVYHTWNWNVTLDLDLATQSLLNSPHPMNICLKLYYIPAINEGVINLMSCLSHWTLNCDLYFEPSHIILYTSLHIIAIPIHIKFQVILSEDDKVIFRTISTNPPPDRRPPWVIPLHVPSLTSVKTNVRRNESDLDPCCITSTDIKLLPVNTRHGFRLSSINLNINN